MHNIIEALDRMEASDMFEDEVCEPFETQPPTQSHLPLKNNPTSLEEIIIDQGKMILTLEAKVCSLMDDIHDLSCSLNEVIEYLNLHERK